MNWKTMNIKDYFQDRIESRKISNEIDLKTLGYIYGCCGLDSDNNLYILMRNFDETVEFLTNATAEEIACAVESLEELAINLPKDKAQIVLDIFKNKLIEFPFIDDICEVEYPLELQIAQDTIDHT